MSAEGNFGDKSNGGMANGVQSVEASFGSTSVEGIALVKDRLSFLLNYVQQGELVTEDVLGILVWV